jgi:hypothetical protein
MPQYRGYDFFVVRDDIVIVEPSTHKIVDVLPHSGRSIAAAPASHKTTFSDRDREVQHARSRTEQRTTGSVASTRVQVGERLPDSVEIRSFPEEIYRESPTLREYRYIERDNICGRAARTHDPRRDRMTIKRKGGPRVAFLRSGTAPPKDVMTYERVDNFYRRSTAIMRLAKVRHSRQQNRSAAFG